MDGDPINVPAASAQLVRLSSVGHVPQARLGPSASDAARGRDSRTRRGIHLTRVVHFNNLGGFEIGGGHRRELHS